MTRSPANTPSRTGVLCDPRYLDHDPGPWHPENPNRLRVIYERLAKPDLAGLYPVISPRMASREELAWNHTPTYIERVAGTDGHGFHQLDPDTATSPGSWKAACLAVGGVFEAIDAIMKGELQNGFALVRPPGHHAEADEARGFCLFNNVALGAHYLLRRWQASRVLVVDWDLHHGNGTQHSFYQDPRVLYFSTHQYPFYPGSGRLEETGQGEGEGYTVNVPLSPGAGDGDFAAIFNRLVRPVGQAFSPDFILVSAGFDICRDDLLGGMAVSPDGFAYLTRVLLDLASQVCEGRILFCLEGGYNLRELVNGTLAVLSECRGAGQLSPATLDALRAAHDGPAVVDRAVELQKRYWPLT